MTARPSGPGISVTRSGTGRSPAIPAPVAASTSSVFAGRSASSVTGPPSCMNRMQSACPASLAEPEGRDRAVKALQLEVLGSGFQSVRGQPVLHAAVRLLAEQDLAGRRGALEARCQIG